MRMLLVLGFVFVFCGAAQVLAAEVSSLRAVRSTAWQSTCHARPRLVIASVASAVGEVWQSPFVDSRIAHKSSLRESAKWIRGNPLADSLHASTRHLNSTLLIATPTSSARNDDTTFSTRNVAARNNESWTDSNIAAEFIISYKAHSNNESTAEKFNIATPTKSANAHFASAPICEFDIEDSTLEIEESPPKQVRAFIKKELYKNQDLLKDCLFSKIGVFVDDHTTSINHAAKSQTSIALKPTRIRAVLGENSLKIYQLRSEHE